MDANVDCCPVDLLTLNTLDVDDKLLTVDLNDLANLLAFVMTSNNLHFIVLADGNTATVVLQSELLGQWRAHDLPSDVGRSIEVTLAILTAR